MNQQMIADLSVELIIKYYDNDYMPFLNAMDDDAMWYGSAEGQFLRGRENMIEAWNAEEHNLKFSLGNMEIAHISSHPSFCNVMLSFHVTTHYPDHHNIVMNQRILLTWCERVFEDENSGKMREPRILVCHIANPHAKHEDDVIYPNRLHEVWHQAAFEPVHGRRIHFHGLDRSDYFFLADTIIRIEAAHGGRHSIVVTAENEVEVAATIADCFFSYRIIIVCWE